MDPLPLPLAFFLLLFSGWVNRQQQAVIDYLLEENRVLVPFSRIQRGNVWELISIAGRYAEPLRVGRPSGFIDVGETRLRST